MSSILGKALAAGVREYRAQTRAASGQHEHQWIDITEYGDGDNIREQCTVSGCGLVRVTPRGQR